MISKSFFKRNAENLSQKKLKLPRMDIRLFITYSKSVLMITVCLPFNIGDIQCGHVEGLVIARQEHELAERLLNMSVTEK